MKKGSRAGRVKPRDERMLDIIGAVYQHRMVEGYNGITPHAVAKKLGVHNIHHIRILCYTLCDAGMLEYIEANGSNGQTVIYLYPKSLRFYYEAARPTYMYLRRRFGGQLPLPPPVGEPEGELE